jgi:hypothetical protein
VSHPEMEEFRKFQEQAKQQILSGFLNFVFSSLVYSLALYLAVRLFWSIDAISWKLSWVNCTSLILGFNFLRVWDRAFMRRS